MAGFDLGDIFVTFKAKTDGLKKGLNDAQRDIDSLGGAIKSKVGAVGAAAFTALKAGAIAAGVAITAFIGKFVAAGGFTRALNIEEAQAKLRGLGHDAGSVKEIMNNALAAVKGTAYSLDQAATTAASAVAAGIKPGQELTRYLKLTADAAYIAGTNITDMGRIFNNVQTIGAAYNDSLQLLAEKGIPIYTWLAKSLGVSEAAVKELASAGKISSEQFRKAIEDNIAGAALKSGETTKGAFENMKAAAARVGSAIADKFLPDIRKALDSVGNWFDENKEGIVNNSVAIANGIGGAFDTTKNAVADLWGWLQQITALPIWGQIGQFLAPAVKALSDTFTQNLLPALSQIWDALKKLWDAINPGFMDALKLLGIILGGLVIGAIWVVIWAVKSFVDVLALVAQAIAIGIDWASKLITWWGQMAAGAINTAKTIFSWFGQLPGQIGNIVNNVVGWFAGLPGRIGDALGGVGNAIIAPFKWAFNKIVDFWNGSVGKLNFRAPDWVPGMGGKSWAMPQLPHLALGTPNWRGGMANMNEFGPETAVLPKGTKVITADQTRRNEQQGQGGNTYVFDMSGIIARSGGELADIMYEGIQALDRRRIANGQPTILQEQTS